MAITSLARIMGSLAMIIFAGAVAAGATGAFFSDTETSTGNTFTAGAIDLQIDNESYITDGDGDLVASSNNTWSLSNLTNQLFFSFTDLKPGDVGEDTISIHVNDNDAWACMAVQITSTPENGQSDPEADEDQTTGSDEGELQDHLQFAFWDDDGDNVFEDGESLALSGTAAELFDGGWMAIADSQGGVFGNDPLEGATTGHIGKAWCFGELSAVGAAEDSTSPLVRGTGFECVASGNENAAQTDGIVADVSFHAEQARNNSDFLCSGLPALEGLDVNVTRDSEETIGETAFTPDMDDDSLIISTKEHYGVHVVYNGSGLSNVNWKLTIAGPTGFDPVTEVDLQEEGFEDTLNGATIAQEQYTFNASGVAEGSVFDVDPNDVFENVDSLHFLSGAPAGQYTITRTLVDSSDTPVSNSLVLVVTLQ